MQTTDFTPEALADLDKARKLFALGRNNDNEHQAAAAIAKAQELLAKHNLEMALIERDHGTGAAKREDKKTGGGLYGWQRDLWSNVAQLNFCMYWSIKGLKKGDKYEHRLLGRHENVIATRVMAEYLQDAIERLTREWAADRYSSIFVREAIAYREGMGRRICERIQALRADQMAEAKRKADEEATRAKHPSAAGTGTSLTIIDVKQSEEDANYEYLHGLEPGTLARRRAEQEMLQAAWVAKYRMRTDDPEQFSRLYPDEWTRFCQSEIERAEREREAQERADKAARREQTMRANGTWKEPKRQEYSEPSPRYRNATAAEQRAMMPSYATGYHKGADVGLDKQVDGSKTRRIG